jgi:hypothetical protein
MAVIAKTSNVTSKDIQAISAWLETNIGWPDSSYTATKINTDYQVCLHRLNTGYADWIPSDMDPDWIRHSKGPGWEMIVVEYYIFKQSGVGFGIGYFLSIEDDVLAVQCKLAVI